MTRRDRLTLVGVVALAVLALVWVLLVAPERNQASKLVAQISQANAALATTEGEAASARAAQTRYSAAYASVVNLGKAVPASEEVPALIYELAQASNQKRVEFSSITTGGVGASSRASSASTAATAAATAGFTQMPFTFVFSGSFADLYHLFQQLNGATVRTASGGLRVSGRLLTLQGVKLEPQSESEKRGPHADSLTGTITATAYVLPAGAGLTGGASAAAPAATAAGTTAASRSGSSATPAAVATGGAVR